MKTVLSYDELLVLAIYQEATLEETIDEMQLTLPYAEDDPEIVTLIQETIRKTASMSEEEYQELLPTLRNLQELQDEEDADE